jgi:Tfp pilus assembly protein FimT
MEEALLTRGETRMGCRALKKGQKLPGDLLCEKREGVTLVELILTILILLLLVLCIAPAFFETRAKASLESEAKRLQAEIMDLQHLAVTRGRPYRVDFLPDVDRLNVYRIDPGPSPVLVRSRRVSNGVDLVSTSFSSNRVELDVLGRPSEGGTIELSAPQGGAAQVNVSEETAFVSII